MQYESSISYGKKVIAKVKVFVHASNADADIDTGHQGYDISSLDIRPGSLKMRRSWTMTCMKKCNFYQEDRKTLKTDTDIQVSKL